MRARGSGAQIQSGETQMWHRAGHRKAAGDCGPCDRHVRSGAESPQDSARSFENARISSGDSRSEQKLGTCSVDISYCAEHLLRRFGGREIFGKLGVLALDESHLAGAARGEHGPTMLFLMGEALNEFAPLLHNGEVSGKVGVKDVVKADLPQGADHMAGGGPRCRQAERLRPSHTDGGSNLNNGRDVRICQRIQNPVGIVTGRQRAGVARCHQTVCAVHLHHAHPAGYITPILPSFQVFE